MQNQFIYSKIDKMIECNVIDILKNGTEIINNYIRGESMYIPGKTMEDEKQRVFIIQNGLVVALVYTIISQKNKEIQSVAEEILYNEIRFYEVRWTLNMLNKGNRTILQKEVPSQNPPSENSLLYENKEDEYSTIRNGKVLTLSES